MPPAIEITLNFLWIPIACIVSALAGFIFRSVQLHKLKEKIHAFEKQSLQADAEILTLQKENKILSEQLKNNSAPVIPITTKENQETLPDTAARKKLLAKPTFKEHS